MNCPLCASTNFITWDNVGLYSIDVCQGCGVGLTTPFPDSAEISDTNTTIYNVDQRISIYLNLRKYLERRYRRQLKRIRLCKPSGKLLDVGCSIGLFVNQANLMGFHAEGVELNRACAEFGINAFGVTIHSNLPEPDESIDDGYDVITLFDVLEHVSDPVMFLAKIKRILKPDGLLIVQTPNLDSLMAELLRDKWAWLSPPDHLFHFSSSTLPRLICKAGFKVNNKYTWEPPNDFAGNLLEAYIPSSFLGNIFRKLLGICRIVELPVFLVQSFWWKKFKGGLVVVEATHS